MNEDQLHRLTVKLRVRIKPGQLNPLEYLLQLMNDNKTPAAKREAIATKLLPYLHPRARQIKVRKGRPPEGKAKVGKKEAMSTAAKKAPKGSEWGELTV